MILCTDHGRRPALSSNFLVAPMGGAMAPQPRENCDNKHRTVLSGRELNRNLIHLNLLANFFIAQNSQCSCLRSFSSRRSLVPMWQCPTQSPNDNLIMVIRSPVLDLSPRFTKPYQRSSASPCPRSMSSHRCLPFQNYFKSVLL